MITPYGVGVGGSFLRFLLTAKRGGGIPLGWEVSMSQAIHDDPAELWWKHRLAKVEREAEQLRARIRDLPVAEQNAVAAELGHALGYPTAKRLEVTPALAFRLAEVAALRHTVTQQQDELRRLEASNAANECGDRRECAEVAEQEVAHLRDRLERVEAALDGERCAAHQDKQALLERLAHQTTLIREQQMVIDHLRRPLSARVVARVARWVRR